MIQRILAVVHKGISYGVEDHTFWLVYILAGNGQYILANIYWPLPANFSFADVVRDIMVICDHDLRR